MTQSVMTQAAGLFTHTSGGVTLKGKQTGNDFGLMIGNSLKASQKNADTKAVQKTPVQATGSKSSIKSDDTNSDDKQTKAIDTGDTAKEDTTKATEKKTEGSLPDDAKTTVSDDTKSDKTKDVTVDDQTMARMQAMLQSIQQAIMEKLNLSTEGFNQLLTDQGLSLTDLLKPENLQQFILANSGKTDLLAFLTDENLADTMKQLLQTINEMKENSNVGLTADQMKALLEQVKGQAVAETGTEDAAPVAGTNDVLQVVQELSDQSKPRLQTAEDNNQNKEAAKETVQTNTVKEASSATPAEKMVASQHSDSNSSSDKDMNNSDRFQAFVDNLVKGSQNPQSNFAREMTQVTNVREIANQIIERIKVSVSANQTSMELQLNPESLGKVNLSVQSRNGVLTAHFVVQNELSKEAIESQLHTLRDTLNQQGSKVEAIEVTVSANAFEQNSNQSTEDDTQTKGSGSGKKITLDDALQMMDAPEDDQSLEELTGISGSVINYTA